MSEREIGIIRRNILPVQSAEETVVWPVLLHQIESSLNVLHVCLSETFVVLDDGSFVAQEGRIVGVMWASVSGQKDRRVSVLVLV